MGEKGVDYRWGIDVGVVDERIEDMFVGEKDVGEGRRGIVGRIVN